MGEGEGAFSDARRLAVDSKGAVFVADKTGRIQKFDSNGVFVSMFRAETTNKPHGAQSTDIGFIQGLAVDRKDHVWVSIGYDLVVYDASSGAMVQKIPHQYPSTCFRDLTFDQTGALFVRTACTDSDRYGIVKLDSGGRVLASWSESPAWQTDSTDKLAIDAAGNIYAPHEYENRVVVLSPQGKETSHFGGRGKTLGFFDVIGPTSLASDAKGQLYAVNEDFIDVYDLQGHAQRRISGRWKRARQRHRDWPRRSALGAHRQRRHTHPPTGIGFNLQASVCGLQSAGFSLRASVCGLQSAGLGGGPSWMRSPMYAPISVNMIPIALMMT